MTIHLPPLKWHQSPNYSARKSRVDLIVIHDCQGGYAGSIATFLKSGGSKPVSAHFVLKEDGSEATQMVRIADKAWHCVSFNSRSVGIEMAGFEEKGYTDSEWSAAAAMTAQLCHQLKIPVQYAKNGAGPGICRHADLGRAGGGHTDPTLDMKVWAGFLAKVKSVYDQGEMLTSWGR